MTVTVAFDVYGTLIDTHAVVTRLQGLVGGRAREFSQAWRDKQLEYSFRRGLMGRYEDFAVCTRQALDYTCDNLRLPLSDSQKADLIELYRVLPAFDDVEEGLAELDVRGLGLYAFSNGSAAAVEALLVTAGIRERFAGVVSVEGTCSFKPDPAVYAHFLEQTGSRAGDTWLVSSNPFDVIGAVATGMRAAWVRRSGQTVFDPWGIEPTATVAGLAGLGKVIAA